MRLKAKDIAKAIGVSAATVSLVLNDKPGVSEGRRAEIIQKIIELDGGYMLKNSQITKNGTIGFVVYKRAGSIVDESPFFTYMLEGINNSVKKYGYNLEFVYISKTMTKVEMQNQVSSSNCRGLIIFAVEMFYDDLQFFKDSGLPFTILDNSFRENDVDAVAINNVQGTSKAINYLYQMGHREIGYIRSKVMINSFIERYDTYKKLLKRLGLRFDKLYTAEVRYNEYDAKVDMKQYLQECKQLPTAFFADNDLLGCAAVKAMQEFGYKIPDNISVIGFDDRPVCTLIEPGLTTISIPKDIFGPAAVELLISKMEKQKEPSLKIDVGTTLIVRESVKDLTKELNKE